MPGRHFSKEVTMDKLTMRWLGHACFALTSDDYHLVLDPYGDGTVPGLPDLQVAANEVLCSHGHRDHCGMDRVMMLLNLRHSPFTVTALPSWHDPEQGALRGENTIHLITCGDLRVAHLGDLGHIPEEETCAALSANRKVANGVASAVEVAIECELAALSDRCPHSTAEVDILGECHALMTIVRTAVYIVSKPRKLLSVANR
jgi:hypothetical protein